MKDQRSICVGGRAERGGESVATATRPFRPAELDPPPPPAFAARARTLAARVCAVLSLAPVAVAAVAQQSSGAEGALGCAACGGCGGAMIMIPIGLVVVNLAILVWVARDAKSRAMDSSVLWMLLVAVTGPIGLIIYTFARPEGELKTCDHCQNKRLTASAKCPHCGNP